MGQSKASLRVDGSTLLRYVVDRLRPAADECIVAGGADPAIAGVRWVADRPPSRGPLSGMAAGLHAASESAAWVVACDLPDVALGLGRILFDALDEWEAVVPRPKVRPQPACAVYRTALAQRIERLLEDGERSLMALLDRSRVRYLTAEELRGVDPELRSFRNLNTPADYERWLSER